MSQPNVVKRVGKKEFEFKISDDSGVSIETTKAVLDAFKRVVIQCSINGEKIGMSGFGTFQGVHRKARKLNHLHRSSKLATPTFGLQFTSSKTLTRKLTIDQTIMESRRLPD